MDADPNIAGTARNALAARYTDLARAQRNNIINSAINGFAGDAISNVQDKVAEEIQKQQSARQQYVDSLGTY